jgi:hypothetical protein
LSVNDENSSRGCADRSISHRPGSFAASRAGRERPVVLELDGLAGAELERLADDVEGDLGRDVPASHVPCGSPTTNGAPRRTTSAGFCG